MSLVQFFADKQDAEDAASAMDKLAGVPIQSRNIGGGVHVDQELAQTKRISEAEFKEDDLGVKRWACECLTQADGRRVEVRGSAYVVNLDGAQSKKELESLKRSRDEAKEFSDAKEDKVK